MPFCQKGVERVRFFIRCCVELDSLCDRLDSGPWLSFMVSTAAISLIRKSPPRQGPVILLRRGVDDESREANPSVGPTRNGIRNGVRWDPLKILKLRDWLFVVLCSQCSCRVPEYLLLQMVTLTYFRKYNTYHHISPISRKNE